MPNRLAKETSPYLLQHANNPVDWHPWGKEAFETAARLNRPVFLSVGYSTCYWCHVMERECFENEAIAALMNEKFVCIKVDREEHPDVDQLYMTAVQLLTQHGGWPMSVFLLPDRRPFYGGTYFPPRDMHGRPGFPTLVNAISEAFVQRRDDIEKTATQLLGTLQNFAQPETNDRPIAIDERGIDALINRTVEEYESTYGGFGRAPKFPRETLLELLLTHHASHPDSHRATMIRHTLDMMANGGIRDQLGGGFHRYSTDDRWLVPHFEIMLYDNALLAWCYLEAFRQFGDERYARIARGVLDFVLREMTDKQTGAFFTAFDAEVDHREGLNYLWTAEEVRRTLTDEPGRGMGAPFSQGDAAQFNAMYGLSDGPNFADPHHGNGRPDKNILHLPHGPEGEDDAIVVRMRQWLLEERLKRKQPLLDTKILTSWNALMIRAFAYGGQILNGSEYSEAATRAAGYLLKHHRQGDGRLLRTSKGDAPATLLGCLDDYAFTAQAFVALHETTGDAKWRDEATAIVNTMLANFGDKASGGLFYTDAGATDDLIVRHKIAGDSPLPSGNAVAAMAMLSLGMKDESRKIVDRFAAAMEKNAEGMSAMVQAMHQHVQANGPFTVAAQRSVKIAQPRTPEQLAHDAVTLGAAWVSDVLLRVNVSIRDGYHINANIVNDDALIATKLEAIDMENVRIEYPEAEQTDFAFSDRPLNVYQGVIAIDVHFEKASDANRGLAFALTYQACDESACLPPMTKQFDLRVG